MTDQRLSAALDKGWTTADGVFCIKTEDLAAALAASATDEGPRLDTPEQTHSVEYNRGWADGNASALDACNPVIERLQTELAARPAVPAALDILDVIDGIVDDTHPEGDGCPLCVALDDLRATLAASATDEGPAVPALDREDVRRVFHDEYERDMSGDRYYGCTHKNQHRKTWDCWDRAQEFMAEYAALSKEPSDD